MRASLSLLLLLGACGPIVQVGGNTPPPVAVYTLSATSAPAVPAGVQPIDRQKAVSIELPTMPAALQTLRVPVTVSDTALQYVTGSQWSEQPNKLFQRLLSDTLVHQGIPVLDVRSSGQSGGQMLSGQLSAFGVDVRAGQIVRVRYDATLVSKTGVRQRRFERELPLDSLQPDVVATTLNSASNLVALDVANWINTST